MALTRIRFDVAGDMQYARAFETFGREADDLREPFQQVAQIIRTSVGEQFRTEGAHAGARWQPLSQNYRIWKEANFGALPMLVRTGAMRGAALDPRAFEISERRLRYEVDDDKAGIHQEGEGHMPRRQIVALTSFERRSMDRAFAGWLNGLRHRIIGG